MKYLLVLLLSVFFFALTYNSAPREFSTLDLIFIACTLTLVFGIQSLITRLFAQHRITQKLVLAMFATLNIVSLNLILNTAFLNLPGYGLAAAVLLALFILFTLMSAVDDNPRGARLLLGLIALASVAVFVRGIVTGMPAPTAASRDGESSAQNIRLVDFESKPNVYFVSFDALWPRSLVSTQLGLATTPYLEVLDANFRSFKNFFADFVPTKPSLNSLLALDRKHYLEINRNRTFFSGSISSPLFEIFKHNGYETSTLYQGRYFGQKKGEYVDNYLVNEKFDVCAFVAEKLKKYTFLGYCALIDRDGFLPLLTEFGIAPKLNAIDFLLENLRTSVQKEKPQVLVAYVYSPGHTEQTFDRDDPGAVDEYANTYIEASAEAAEYLQKIIDFVAEEDPDAILYVFGDHGPWMSRQDTIETDPATFIADRFGVYGGVFPSNRCVDSFSQPYTEQFTTIMQGAHMIIRCLSGGENAFLELNDYHHLDLGMPKQYRYEDYLYE